MKNIGQLDIKRHANYFNMCLRGLPSVAQSEDANRMALIYFCLQGLDILKELNLGHVDKQRYGEFILSHLRTDEHNGIQYFIPSMGLRVDQLCAYTTPGLTATLFGLMNLLILNVDYALKIDSHKIMKLVQRCQIRKGSEKGGFMSVLDSKGSPFGEADLRLCYVAAKIRVLCKYDQLPAEQRINDIDVPELKNYVLERCGINGGFSSTRSSEVHAGFTYCGIACLALIGFDFNSEIHMRDSTVDWLMHRHIYYEPSIYAEQSYEYWDIEHTGAFNGRENKFGDTCYSWWCTASLYVMGQEYFNLIDFESATDFLLNISQNAILGGFGKDKESRPDPFHSFLAISSLAIWKDSTTQDYEGKNNLKSFDPLMMLSQDSLSFFRTKVDLKSP